jgi:hypothetical protein
MPFAPPIERPRARAMLVSRLAVLLIRRHASCGTAAAGIWSIFRKSGHRFSVENATSIEAGAHSNPKQLPPFPNAL